MKLNQENVNSMKSGVFNNSSYFGYKSKILKSGICKYFRRGINDKFEWCVIEMLLFGIKNKGLVTNLLNRLKILIMEDVLYSDISIISKCIDILNDINVNHSIETNIKKLLLFCKIVTQAKRSRICSYLNNWWKYNEKQWDFEHVKVDKVLKYKKDKDTIELLQLGELLIETNDEGIFDIFNKMVQLNGVFGRRYRRNEAIYLFWEIMNDKCKEKKVFDFALEMFMRKQMKERFHYGVWIGMIVLYDMENRNINDECNVNIDEYIDKREKIDINEDFVVNDWHVNKKFGLGKYSKVGAFIVNEEFGAFDIEKVKKYKDFYITCKENNDKVNHSKPNNVFYNLKYIDFNEFKIIKVIEEGVCGLKKCCIIVEYQNEKYVLKEMKNGGADYMFMDSIKSYFGIIDLNMIRIKTNKTMERIDKTIRTYSKGNWKFSDKNNVIYCMMKYYENKGDAGKNQELFKDNIEKQKELIKIRLFNGLFRSSDNIMRNILVDINDNLISIDENDIFGKRKHIFDKHDWCKKHINKDIIINMIDEIICVDKNKIIEKMKLYGFHDKITEFKERFDNYKQIVLNEIS